jgi:hypothetical protein
LDRQGAVLVTAGVITSIAPFGLFLVLALVIPHPFPGVTEAMTRILYAAACVIVMISAIVMTWRNRRTGWFARLMTRLTAAIFGVGVIGVGASFFSMPGLITLGGAISFFTLPVLVLSLLNRLSLRQRQRPQS